MSISNKKINKSSLTEASRLLDTRVDDSDEGSDQNVEFQPRKHVREHKVGVFVVILAIVGSIVGGGVVSMPYATLQTGIWLSLGINIYNYIWGVYAWYLLMEAKNLSGLASFAQLGFYCFGRASIFVICAMIALGSWGFPIVYFKIFGEAWSSLFGMIHFLHGTFFATKTFTQLMLGVALLYFAIKKEIAELKIAGFILLGGLFLFILFLTIRLLQGKGEDISQYNMSKVHWDMELLANIPTLILSYGFQSAFFPAFNSLKEKTDKNGMKATYGAFTICFVVYISIILVSLFTYGEDIKENILTNVGKSSDFFSVFLQIIFLIIAAMHIPIVFFIGKENVLILVDELLRRSYSTGHGLRKSLSHIEETPDVDFNEDNHNIYLTMNPVVYYTVSISIYALIIVISITVKSLVLLLGIIGSTASAFTIYLGPGAFYIKWYRNLQKDGSSPTGYKPKSKFDYYMAWVFFIKGVILMVVLNFGTIFVAIKG